MNIHLRFNFKLEIQKFHKISFQMQIRILDDDFIIVYEVSEFMNQYVSFISFQSNILFISDSSVDYLLDGS